MPASCVSMTTTSGTSLVAFASASGPFGGGLDDISTWDQKRLVHLAGVRIAVNDERKLRQGDVRRWMKAH